MAKQKGELRCCERCGRDTRSLLCRRCTGRQSMLASDEMKGRPQRTPAALGGTPIRDARDVPGEADGPTAAEEYHGGTSRDDI